MLNVKAIYQSQAKINYILGGLSLAKMIGEEQENYIGAGIWARSNDAISPYLFFEFNKIQTGISYDIISSKLNSSSKPLRSIEFSLQFKLSKNND